MCRRLIDAALLTGREKRWLNEYHAEVWAKTEGFFAGDERTFKWLRRETEPIE
jgi:Xaa-Pro aminopeptidase